MNKMMYFLFVLMIVHRSSLLLLIQVSPTLLGDHFIRWGEKCEIDQERLEDRIEQCFFICFFFNWNIVVLQVVLVSAVQQCESAICVHIFPLS